MIPHQNTAVEVETHITGEKIAMGLHVQATPHLMNVLTNLYTRPKRAAIREYATNARDAQIEAGYVGPIEVELPNPMAPFLTIRDHGVGLSREDIIEIYSQYGASTKRETDDQQGCLGLGCKAALAIAQQFTLVSVKNHKRTTVVVSREQDGGSMTINSVIDTTEANGTTVQIPVDPADAHLYRKEADFLFGFWDEGTVLVDGEQPARINGLDISEEIKLIDGDQDYIVMGGVPYPTDLRTGLNNRGIAAWVPMGSVAFVPAREGLDEDDPITEECKRLVEETFKHHVPSAVQRAIDACNTKAEALETMVSWDRLMPRSVQSVTYTFQGQQVPINFTSKDVMFTANEYKGYWDKVSKHTKDRQVYAAQWPTTLWVMGYDKDSFTATTRKKIDKFLRDDPRFQNHRFEYYTCVRDTKLDIVDWVDPENIVDWKVIELIKLPRKGREAQAGRVAGSYDMYLVKGGEATWEEGVVSDDIPANVPVFYCDADEDSNHMHILKNFEQDFAIVPLSPNRVAKFERLFPNAMRSRTKILELHKAWAKKITRNDRLAFTIQQYNTWDCRELRKLDAKKIDDPDVRKAIRLAGRDLTKTIEDAKLFGSIASTSFKVDWTNPLDDESVYPLYNSDCEKNHLYMYLNVAYAAKKESK